MYQRIVTGTDGSERSTVAVERAARFAETCGAELHVVQGCGSPIVVSSMHGEVSAYDPATVLDASLESLAALRDELRARGLTVDVHAVPEGGADALLDVAKRVDADLIIVGNRGMTGVRRMLGSVPNTVAHSATCAVLIVPTD